MSANTNELQSFSVREVPWWDRDGKSVRPDYPATLAEAMNWAGLDSWEPVSEAVYAKREVGGEIVFDAIDGAARVTRSDDNSITLGMVGDQWTAIPNRTPFELVAHILDSRGLDDDGNVPDISLETQIFADLGIRIETGGYLGDGETVWVCGKMDDAVVLPGDFSPTDLYVVATMANDGTGALKSFSTMIRAVCQNTIKAGEMQAEADQSLYSFRHSASWREKLEIAKKVVKGSLANRERLAEIYEELSGITIADETIEDFLLTLIPDPSTITTRSMNNVLRDRGKVREMLNSPTTLPVADKALGLWLAAGEFFDHGRRFRSQSSYVNRTLITPQKGKLIALDVLSELTGAKVGPTYDAQVGKPTLVTV